MNSSSCTDLVFVIYLPSKTQCHNHLDKKTPVFLWRKSEHFTEGFWNWSFMPSITPGRIPWPWYMSLADPCRSLVWHIEESPINVTHVYTIAQLAWTCKNTLKRKLNQWYHLFFDSYWTFWTLHDNIFIT